MCLFNRSILLKRKKKKNICTHESNVNNVFYSIASSNIFFLWHPENVFFPKTTNSPYLFIFHFKKNIQDVPSHWPFGQIDINQYTFHFESNQRERNTKKKKTLSFSLWFMIHFQVTDKIIFFSQLVVIWRARDSSIDDKYFNWKRETTTLFDWARHLILSRKKIKST